MMSPVSLDGGGAFSRPSDRRFWHNARLSIALVLVVLTSASGSPTVDDRATVISREECGRTTTL